VGYPDSTVVEINYDAKDSTTQKYLDIRDEFTESLHHRSWIVQVKQLKERRRNEMEKILSIFDQDNLTDGNHILNINEEDFPEEYRPIIQRLRMAYESEDIQRKMEMEDDYMEYLLEKERELAQEREDNKEKDKIIEKERKEKEKITKEKEEITKEKEEITKEKEKITKENQELKKENQEKDKALEEKERLIEELQRQVEGIKKKGDDNNE
jgi:hypothetical protein